MTFAIVFLPLVFLAGWVVYVGFMAAVAMFGIAALLVTFLLTGLYQILANSLGADIALGLTMSAIAVVGLMGWWYQRRLAMAEAEMVRQREEQARIEAERFRAGLQAKMDEEARLRRHAIGLSWHDRSFEDWKRIWFN